MKRHHGSNHGFTLVELMVTLVVSFLVIAAVYASYVVQQRTQTEQQQVTRIQQNLRSGMMMMAKEFKMAGYDPLLTGGYGITTATPTTLAFTADLCEDGGPPKPAATLLCTGAAPAPATPRAGQRLEEFFTYQLFDSDGDGRNDALQRIPAIAPNPAVAIAENIEQIEFSYIMKNGSIQQTVGTGQLENIRAVQIALLARADQPDFRYTNQQTYTTLFDTEWDPAKAVQFPIANSLNYRRRILLATIELRNMGLL
ncbi:MAG: PilW family protein [Desulfobulbaceae bacterium]